MIDIAEFIEILDEVIDNGRVGSHDGGGFITASLEAEVEFEAEERGFSQDDIAEAVAFALAHSMHHD